MSILKNPFAVRDGKTVFISDISANERGIKCACHCPNCAGEFIARMGDVRVKHFAHSSNPCDEVVAYITGLINMIYQVLIDSDPLYVPALIASYTLPYRDVLDETNVESHVKIVSESYVGSNRIDVSPGKYVRFDNVEIIYDKHNNAQAIEVSVGAAKMAIKVMLPDTVCKIGSISRHADLATLVIDFKNDYEIIQSSTTESFKKSLLSDAVSKYWVYNPKIKEAYPVIIDLSIKSYEEWLDHEKRHEEACKKQEQKEAARRKELYAEKYAKTRVVDAEQLKKETHLGFMEVKDKDFTKTERVIDSFNRRWLKCEICNEVKLTSEFVPGITRGSYGRCVKCNNLINRKKIF